MESCFGFNLMHGKTKTADRRCHSFVDTGQGRTPQQPPYSLSRSVSESSDSGPESPIVVQDMDIFYYRQLANSLQDQELQQKIDHEIKMRDGTAKLLAASKHPAQMLEAAKSLLTSNTRMISYMTELQKRKTDEVLRRKSWTDGNQLPCKARVCVSDLRVPLMWRDTDHFKNKGDYRRYAVFCVWKLGTDVYDTTLIKDVDRSMTDLYFKDVFVFNNVSHDFECQLEVYCHKLFDDVSIASTPKRFRKKINDLSTSFGRSVGKRLSGLKEDTDIMANMVIGPKYEQVAHATLKLTDIRDAVSSFDLVMNSSTSSSTDTSAGPELPLFGHFCCRLVAQPHCLVDPTVTGHLQIQSSQRWCVLRCLQISCWDNAEDADDIEPVITIPITKDTQISEGLQSGTSRGRNIQVSMHGSRKPEFILTAETEKDHTKWWEGLQQHLLDQALWQHACEKKMEIREASPDKVPSYLRKGSLSLYESVSCADSPRSKPERTQSEDKGSPLLRILDRIEKSEQPGSRPRSNPYPITRSSSECTATTSGGNLSPNLRGVHPRPSSSHSPILRPHSSSGAARPSPVLRSHSDRSTPETSDENSLNSLSSLKTTSIDSLSTNSSDERPLHSELKEGRGSVDSGTGTSLTGENRGSRGSLAGSGALRLDNSGVNIAALADIKPSAAQTVSRNHSSSSVESDVVKRNSVQDADDSAKSEECTSSGHSDVNSTEKVEISTVDTPVTEPGKTETENNEDSTVVDEHSCDTAEVSNTEDSKLPSGNTQQSQLNTDTDSNKTEKNTNTQESENIQDSERSSVEASSQIPQGAAVCTQSSDTDRHSLLTDEILENANITAVDDFCNECTDTDDKEMDHTHKETVNNQETDTSVSNVKQQEAAKDPDPLTSKGSENDNDMSEESPSETLPENDQPQIVVTSVDDKMNQPGEDSGASGAEPGEGEQNYSAVKPACVQESEEKLSCDSGETSDEVHADDVKHSSEPLSDIQIADPTYMRLAEKLPSVVEVESSSESVTSSSGEEYSDSDINVSDDPKEDDKQAKQDSDPVDIPDKLQFNPADYIIDARVAGRDCLADESKVVCDDPELVNKVEGNGTTCETQESIMSENKSTQNVTDHEGDTQVQNVQNNVDKQHDKCETVQTNGEHIVLSEVEDKSSCQKHTGHQSTSINTDTSCS